MEAQTILPGTIGGFGIPVHPINNFGSDSLSKSKWSANRFTMLSNNYMFFNGGSANILSATTGFQLTRKLSNNLYAYGNIALAPSLYSFNSAFSNATNKSNPANPFAGQQGFGVYTAASLGLMYINNDKTFSISGGFSVQRSNMPFPGMMQTNTTKPGNTHLINR
jgi:hypothetical protein